MKRINILVEGETEEAFVKSLLTEPFAMQGIYLSACRVTTNRKLGKKGGATNYFKFRHDLLNWLEQDPQAMASMMFDLYALPETFPGVIETREQNDPYLRVAMLEQALIEDISQDCPDALHRFIPYIQLHEFESLLFSHPPSLGDGLTLFLSDTSFESELCAILEQAHNNPELINDGLETAPSKRLENLFKRYNKTYKKPLLGLLVAETIGLAHLRAHCPHFNHWLEKMEEKP